jgi:SAM-dependent methyltransferase
VVFNTSLDHIFDWRRAIDEARRVLVPGGCLYISTLIWTDRADLVTDAVHFHHFRDYEIFGVLGDWELVDERRYDYKGASHRHGLYLAARKTERNRV